MTSSNTTRPFPVRPRSRLDILNEVMEQIRPLNDALTEKARVTHALRKLIACLDADLPNIGADTGACERIWRNINAAKEALK